MTAPNTSSTVDDGLDASILAHFAQTSSAQILPTDANLRQISTKRAWLEEEKSRREAVIQCLYDELYVLWAKLGVPEAEQEAFLERWKGTEQQSIDAVRISTLIVSTRS